MFSCSGFDSLTAKHDLARWCHDNLLYQGKSSVVMHLGDHDPSGVSIFESVRDDVHAFLAKDVPHKDSEQVAEFRRVALTEEMVGYHQLPTAPPKKTDSRSERWESGGTCQLEALPPDMLAQTLETVIEDGNERNGRWTHPVLDSVQLEEDREAEVTSRRNIVRALPGATP